MPPSSPSVAINENVQQQQQLARASVPAGDVCRPTYRSDVCCRRACVLSPPYIPRPPTSIIVPAGKHTGPILCRHHPAGRRRAGLIEIIIVRAENNTCLLLLVLAERPPFHQQFSRQQTEAASRETRAFTYGTGRRGGDGDGTGRVVLVARQSSRWMNNEYGTLRETSLGGRSPCGVAIVDRPAPMPLCFAAEKRSGMERVIMDSHAWQGHQRPDTRECMQRGRNTRKRSKRLVGWHRQLCL